VPFLINIYIVIINGNAKEKYIKLSLNSKLKGQKVNKGFWGWGWGWEAQLVKFCNSELYINFKLWGWGWG